MSLAESADMYAVVMPINREGDEGRIVMKVSERLTVVTFSFLCGTYEQK